MSTRLIGEHFTRDGKPKRSYASKQEARERALRLHQQHYHCKFCGLWHLAKERG